METFIPEEEYLKIVKILPIFCADFLIRHKDKYLLVKRKQQPVKDVYWPVGGRLRFRETIDQLARRVHTRELGRYFPNYKLIGFSNYIFERVQDERATHTPCMLYLIEVDEMFDPNIDDTHSDFIWTSELPFELKNQTNFIHDYA